MKILVDQGIPYAAEIFSPLGHVVRAGSSDITQDAVERIDALVVRAVTSVDSKLLDESSVRVVASVTSGTDHVDLNYLESRRIFFAHAPGSNARAVAEHVLINLCLLAEKQRFPLLQKKIGIVGHGHIGSVLAAFLEALGIATLLYDPPRQKLTGNTYYVTRNQLLEEADIITLHVPLTTDDPYPTKRMVDHMWLSRWGDNKILVNTARGEVVDEKALLTWQQQHGLTLITDVWCNEPRINLALLESAAFASPHIAGYSVNGKMRATEMIYCALRNFLAKTPEGGALATAPAWKAPPDESFAIAAPHVRALTDLPALLLQLPHQGYNFSEKSHQFKSALLTAPEKTGTVFQTLRARYPLRPEFSAWQIALSATALALAMPLRKLGFQVISP